MTQADSDYFRRRAREEVERARQSPDEAIRAIHQQLADAYTARIAENAPPPADEIS